MKKKKDFIYKANDRETSRSKKVEEEKNRKLTFKKKKKNQEKRVLNKLRLNRHKQQSGKKSAEIEK